MWISRGLNILVGVAGITVSCFVQNMGTLFDVGTKILGSFAAIMLGIFWLGMFTKRATLLSTMVGAMIGVAIMLVLTFVEEISIKSTVGAIWVAPNSIGAIWVAPAALLATLVFGVILGTSNPGEGGTQWNWWAIMQKPLPD